MAITTGSLWPTHSLSSATGELSPGIVCMSAQFVLLEMFQCLWILTNPIKHTHVQSGCVCLGDRVKESTGWQQVFTSPRLDWVIDRVALNAKVMGGSLGDNDKMVAVASVTEIILWSICPDGNGNEIGTWIKS